MTSRTTGTEPGKSALDHVLAAVPLLALLYLVIGVVWADQHMAHLNYVTGFDLWFSWLGEVVAWPLLIFIDVNAAGLRLQ